MIKNVPINETMILQAILIFVAVFVIAGGTVLAQTKDGLNQSIIVAEEGDNGVPQLAEDKIRKKLSRHVTLSLCSLPLEDFVNMLAKRLAVNVLIDRAAFEESGATVTVPITLKVNRISVRSALNLILRPAKLGWMVRDEALIITTPEVEEEHLTSVVYDVTDLVNTTVGSDSAAEVDFDSLIELVYCQVAPDSWGVGNSGDIVGYQLDGKKLLIILQTDDTHFEIKKLFQSLRNAFKAKS